MGKKLDALLGRCSFKPVKFKPLVNLAISRLSVLKNHRQIRLSQSTSDVLQLLNLGHHERALLRVEQVVKEQNMLDVFVMIEAYCHLLIERTNLIEQQKECPDELKEAASSLLYAASRCGEFPELQEIRAMLTSHYGKEFAARAIELRNNCGVNTRMIQKLSTRMPSLESRMNALKEIADENGITLLLEETFDKPKISQKQNELEESDPAASSGSVKVGDGMQISSEEVEKNEGFSGSLKMRKYKDVADAAQAAFESAAYAAAAARAAVELSRADSHDPDDQNSPNPRRRKLSDREELMKYKNENAGESESVMGENSDNRVEFEKVQPSESYGSESGDEDIQSEESNAAEWKKSKSSSSVSAEDILKVGVNVMSSDVADQPKPLAKEICFDESDDENVNKEGSVPLLKTHNSGLNVKPNSLTNEEVKTEKHGSGGNDPLEENKEKLHRPSRKQIYTKFKARMNMSSGYGDSPINSAEESGIRSAPTLNIERKPISVRTRRLHVH